MKRLIALIGVWWAQFAQVVGPFIVEPRPTALPTPPKTLYPPGFTFTTDGCFFVWTCDTCRFPFVFGAAYDPVEVRHALGVHRIRCEVRPNVAVVSPGGAG